MSRMRRGPLIVLLILLVSMTMGSASASQPIVQSDSNTMDLRLGANGTSEMNIGPGATVGIAINVTNLASSARSVDVTIRDTDAWAWEFNGMNSTGANATIRLEPQELEWIRFNVTAPFVRNGTPRAGTGEDLHGRSFHSKRNTRHMELEFPHHAGTGGGSLTSAHPRIRCSIPIRCVPIHSGCATLGMMWTESNFESSNSM